MVTTKKCFKTLLVILFAMILSFNLVFLFSISGNAETVKAELSQDDKDILRYYHEM